MRIDERFSGCMSVVDLTHSTVHILLFVDTKSYLQHIDMIRQCTDVCTMTYVEMQFLY